MLSQSTCSDQGGRFPAYLRTVPRPHLLPFCLAQARQRRKHGRALQPPATVDGDAIAVNVAGLIGYQMGGEIGEFAMLSGAARGLKLSQCSAIDAGTSRSQAPLVGKAPGEIATARMPFGPHSTARLLVMASTPALAIALGTHRATQSSVGRDDAEDDTAVAFGDPTLAGGERAISGAVQHDVEDGIDGAVGECLGAGNEVTCSIVDQHIERCVGKGSLHQAIDSFGRANVDDTGSNLAGQRVFELFSGILKHLGAPTTDHQLCAELYHAPPHGLAKPGAAAGDQHALSLEKIGLEHDGFPLWPLDRH